MPTDSGQYTCIVSNEHGSINHTYTLEVIGKLCFDCEEGLSTWTISVYKFLISFVDELSIEGSLIVLISF